MAAYFDSYTKTLSVQQGSLPDDVFLGTLLAVGVYSKYDLIENIFASRPEDFSKFGVYTCRFYVDGEWVEVITDTILPCTRDNSTGKVLPVYGRSALSNEMWIPLVEKAFAKAMGSYEAITSIKVQKALLHLTGGSVQLRNLRDDVTHMDSMSDQVAWQDFKKKVSSDCLMLLLPQERKAVEAVAMSVDGLTMPESNSVPDTGIDRLNDHFFVPNRLYSIVMCRDHGGYELVLMHSPWTDPGYVWTGEWSDSSNDWDLYPELLYELEKDPSVPWTRRTPNGYFWIAFRQMVKYFNKLYQCQLFPNEKYKFYCLRGECRGVRAGGPLHSVRDKEQVLSAAAASKSLSLQKSTAAVVIDGDASWFTNPQYRIHCSAPTTIFVSLIPLGNGDEGDMDQASMALTVCKSPRHTSSSLTMPVNLWELTQFEIEATDRPDNGPMHVKGQETSAWAINIDHKHYYHVVPNTTKRQVACEYILRVFSSKPVSLEAVPDLPRIVEKGEWRRVGEIDTTGGPPTQSQADGVAKDNPKWCQNPQYHLQITDPFGKDDIFLKIVLRRTENNSRKGKAASGSAAQAVEQKKSEATLGLVICKASILEDNLPKALKKAPRQNKLGEPIPLKASSLKKRRDPDLDTPAKQSSMPVKTVLRTLHLDPAEFQMVTSFNGKNESCVFFPKIPRSWIPNGLIVVPCMSEKGARSPYELEIFSSERIQVSSLPEAYSRSMAGDWGENMAGGSHIYPGWKKNPRFLLRFHNPVNTDAPARLRITLARHGPNWRPMAKKDTVGCMIGFYIFLAQGDAQTQIYESTFVPDDEMATDPTFSLPQLAHGETYIIMPATFGENKFGSFVLSILSEYEFHLAKDK